MKRLKQFIQSIIAQLRKRDETRMTWNKQLYVPINSELCLCEYIRVVRIDDISDTTCDVWIEVEQLDAKTHEIVYHVVLERDTVKCYC